MEFSYKINSNGDKLFFIELRGRLMDKAQAAEMLAEIDQQIKSGHNQIILDMHEMEYMNSSGLNVLVNILTKARSASGEVVVADVNPKVRELFLITKLNTLFAVLDSREEAVQHFKK